MRPFVYLLGLTGLTLLSGCSGMLRLPSIRTKLPDAFPYHNAEQIHRYIVQSTDTLESFQAKASIAVRSPEENGRFNADIRDRRNDSLYISFSPGLGLHVARALVTPDSFFVYDRVKRQLTYGSLLHVEKRLPIPVSDADLFGNLLGIVSPEQDVDWKVEADSIYYYLYSPENTRKYIVDPGLWRIIRYEERTPDGALVEERTYTNFDLFGAVYLPRRIIIRRPLEDSIASIYYRSLTLNPPTLSFDLNVRASVERILLD